MNIIPVFLNLHYSVAHLHIKARLFNKPSLLLQWTIARSCRPPCMPSLHLSLLGIKDERRTYSRNALKVPTLGHQF